MDHSHPNYQLKGFREFTMSIGTLDGTQKQFSNSNMADTDFRETTENGLKFLFPPQDVDKSHAIERTINHPVARSFLRCGELGHRLLPE